MKLIRKPVIFLLGPTAAGKTEWAINWQNKFKVFEIISVDSVMVYKECNIGSAKPSKKILKKNPHHLIDYISLNNVFSVSNFYDEANKLIKEIHAQNKIPLMVGGSMMYFNVLKNGLSYLPAANDFLRRQLKEKIINYGVENLYKDLEQLDPNASKYIQPKDSQRIIRAIEIITLTGRSLDKNFSDLDQISLKEKYNLIEYGIFPEQRSELHQRIENRQESLVGDKLLFEIEMIKKNFNISAEHPAMKAINYRQGLQVINGQIKKSELFEKSIFATRQLAKRQCTWMRSWKGLKNFDVDKMEVALEELKKQLNFS